MSQDEVQYFNSRDLTVREVAHGLHCSNPTVYKLINEGRLKSYKLLNSRRVTRQSYEKLRQGETAE